MMYRQQHQHQENEEYRGGRSKLYRIREEMRFRDLTNFKIVLTRETSLLTETCDKN